MAIVCCSSDTCQTSSCMIGDLGSWTIDRYGLGDELGDQARVCDVWQRTRHPMDTGSRCDCSLPFGRMSPLLPPPPYVYCWKFRQARRWDRYRSAQYIASYNLQATCIENCRSSDQPCPAYLLFVHLCHRSTQTSYSVSALSPSPSPKASPTPSPGPFPY